MKHAWIRMAALGVASILLIAAYKRTEQSSVMADAAQHFLEFPVARPKGQSYIQV